MDFKAKIEELSASIEDLDEQSVVLQQEAWGLRQERDKIVGQMILEQSLLSGTTWNIKVGGADSSTLEFQDASKSTSMDYIVELTRKDYHSWFDLADGIQLRFDDSDISLHFKESKQVLPFAKKQGMILIGTGVTDQLAKLKRQVAALELICHQYNI